MREIKKIIILGPESTGKSTLTQKLAEHYNTVWCSEYAREYLLEHGTKYTFDDLLTIAKGQLRLEEEYVRKAILLWKSNSCISSNPILFADTDMHVMKVWCEYVFQKCHTFILDKVADQKADLYLLCNIDLPWIKDELREYPDLKSREELYHIYKDILINQSVPWTDISGTYDERLTKAIKAVDLLLD